MSHVPDRGRITGIWILVSDNPIKSVCGRDDPRPDGRIAGRGGHKNAVCEEHSAHGRGQLERLEAPIPAVGRNRDGIAGGDVKTVAVRHRREPFVSALKRHGAI